MINPSCCPVDCEDMSLPEVSFSDCIEAFQEELSQISEVIISEEDPDNPGQPLYKPTDMADPADWISMISNDGNGARRLIGLGSLPAPEKQRRDISKRRTKKGASAYMLNFVVDEVTQANYDFTRNLACGKKVFLWYVTNGGFVYGSENGIKAEVYDADPIWDADVNSYVRLEFNFRWEAHCPPERNPYPLAEGYDGGEEEGEIEG